MKKLLAVVIAVIMTFSLAAVSASAAAPDMDKVQGTVDSISGSIVGAKDEVQNVIDSATGIYDDLKNEDYSTIIEDVVDFAEFFFEAIHAIVHNLSVAFDFECTFCTVVVEEPVA